MQQSELEAHSESGHSQKLDSSAFSAKCRDVRPFTGWKRSLDESGRDDGSEPKVTDAAACMNDRSANQAVSNVRFVVVAVHDS